MLNRFFFVFLALSLCSSPALAFPQVFPAPALNGPTGLIRIPSADVIPYKNLNIGADFGMTVSSFSSSEATINYKMNLGTFNGVELGIVGGTDQGSGQLREGVFVNSKISLSTGEDAYPLLLAIGIENLFSHTNTDVFMVATKYFKQGPKVTFGFMADFPENKFRPLGLLGIESALGETFFAASDMLLGETLSQVNAGVKLYFTPIFSINLYALNIFDSSTAKDSRSALLGFSWANPF